MPSIFISHSSLDQGAADDIKSALAALGFERVFLDFDKVTGVGAGENWERRLFEELSRCHAVVLVLTPNWLASKWCFAELQQARALGKVILPVVCAPLGDRTVLPEIQSVDMLDWNAGGLDRLQQRLRTITNELARGFRLAPNRPPFPGIHAFEAEDAAIYFGRDEETRAAIERLDARRTQGGSPFLIVIGASGSGKSSLLKAGVLPQLARRTREWIVLPCVRPEKNPMEMIAKSVAQQLGKSDTWRTWQQTLSSAVAIDHAQELLKDLRVGDARAATVLLPIDQFEEVFTIAEPAERTVFLHLLASVVAPARKLPLIVIATARSDVMEGLLQAGDLIGLSETFPLSSIPLDRVSRLVEGPAAVAAYNVEHGLTEAITRDVQSPDALPLLAHALWVLYRRGEAERKLSLAEYYSLGDPERGLNPIENSVRLAADRAIAGLRPGNDELLALRDAFVPHLVRLRLDDGKRVRQPARRSELPRAALPLIDALIAARLLSARGSIVSDDATAANAAGEVLVEVTHEALFKAWPTLDQWLTEEHGFLSDIERIKLAHEEWSRAAGAVKNRALLGGLLLSRARDWIVQYPQRFLGHDMAELRGFIAASAAAEDVEKKIAAEQEARVRRAERRMLWGAIAAAVLVLGTGLVLKQWGIAETLREEVLLDSRARLARITTDSGDATTGVQLALAALPSNLQSSNVPFVPSAEYALQNAYANMRERIILSGHTGPVNSAVFSPDGSRAVTASPDGTARVWDVKTGGTIGAPLQHSNQVTSAVFSPDGTRVLTASFDKTAAIWDAATGARLLVLQGHTDALNRAVFSHDGKRIVTASFDNTARIWNASSGAQLVLLQGHTRRVVDAAFATDGARVVTASRDSTARIWDAATGDTLRVLTGHNNLVNFARFSPDGVRVATGSRDSTARLWDATSGVAIAVMTFGGQVVSASFSPDSKKLVTASYDNTAVVWDATTGAKLTVLQGHQAQVTSAMFSPDGSRVVTASWDSSARLWDAASGTMLSIVRGPAQLQSAVIAPDSTQLVTASVDGTARLWNAETQAAAGVSPEAATYAAYSPDGSRLATVSSTGTTGTIWDIKAHTAIAHLSGHTSGINAIAFSPDGRRVATASWDMTARIWDATTGALLVTMSGQDDSVLDVAFSPDGLHIITASRDTRARVFDASTGRLLTTLSGHNDAVVTAVFSPDGRRIVTSSYDGTIRQWDTQTEQEIQPRLPRTGGSFNAAAYSPDGSVIAAGSFDLTARLWKTADGSALAVLRGHNGPVLTVAFSPDGALVATGSSDKTARLWDAKSGAPMVVFNGHADQVDSVAFSPDGSGLLTGSFDNTVRMWRLPPKCQSLIDAARARLPKGLSVVDSQTADKIDSSWLGRAVQPLRAMFVGPVLQCH